MLRCRLLDRRATDRPGDLLEPGAARAHQGAQITWTRDPETGALKMGATSWRDNGVVMPEADETRMLTVWFPLRDAGVEHGCR